MALLQLNSLQIASAPINRKRTTLVVPPGAPGQIELGSGIDRTGLLARAAEIGNWGVERIYPWSCRVGAELYFVSALQELSGVWVFASAEALGQGKALMGAN